MDMRYHYCEKSEGWMWEDLAGKPICFVCEQCEEDKMRFYGRSRAAEIEDGSRVDAERTS